MKRILTFQVAELSDITAYNQFLWPPGFNDSLHMLHMTRHWLRDTNFGMGKIGNIYEPKLKTQELKLPELVLPPKKEER